MEGIPEIVVRSPDLFKIKLGIGEDAYQFLKVGNNLTKMWDVYGAGATGASVAGSAVVANTFFAGNGLLSLIGIGAAATPIGWVVAAGLASGAAYYGISNILEKQKDGMVKVVPTFINTPLDVLAVGISNLMFPLAVQVALADGDFSEDEKEEIFEYFAHEWGYDRKYIETRLTEISGEVNRPIEEMTDSFFKFIRENKDCNHRAISDEVVSFLHDIAKADGIFTSEEKEALAKIEASINAQLSSEFSTKVANSLDTVRAKSKSATGAVGQKLSTSASKVKESASHLRMPNISKPSFSSLKSKSGVAFSSVAEKTKAARDKVSNVLPKKDKTPPA